MFGFNTERKEIAAIRERIAAQRASLTGDVHDVAIQARKVAQWSTLAMGARRTWSLIGPLLLGLARRAPLPSGRNWPIKVVILIGGTLGLRLLWGKL